MKKSINNNRLKAVREVFEKKSALKLNLLPTKGVEISGAIKAMVEAQPESGDDLEETPDLVKLAVAAWNYACWVDELDPDAIQKEMSNKTYSDTKLTLETFIRLIEHKKQHCNDIKSPILDFVFSNGQLQVVSIPATSPIFASLNKYLGRST